MAFLSVLPRPHCDFVIGAVLAVVWASVGSTQDLPASPPPTRPVLELRIDANSSDANLSQIFGISVDKSGRIFVLDAKEQTVHVFAPSGKPLRNLGRKGGGPGEFEHASAVSIRRDSLWISELSSARLTAFPLQGGAPRTSRVIAQVTTSNQIYGVLANGYLASVAMNSAQTMAATSQFQFVRIDDRGKMLNDVLGKREKAPTFELTLKMAGAPNSRPFASTQQRQPFLTKPLPVIAADGQSVIALTSQEAPRSLSKFDVITLVAVGLRGDTLWTKKLTHTPVAITDAHFQQMIDSLAKPITLRVGTRVTADRKVLRDSLLRPANWPAVTELLAGLDGTIWLKHGAPLNGKESFWYRLSPTGVLETVVRIPAGLNLTQASRDRLWGWRLDADDAPIIERYRY